MLRIICFLVTLTLLLPAQEDQPVDSSAVTTSKMPSEPVYRPLEREVPNRAFRVGERLTFTIRYGFVKAGEAVMEVTDSVLVRDSIPAYHITSLAQSASFFDNFYKVRDTVETFVDVRRMFSWKFSKKLREGGYLFDLLVDYDQHYGSANVKRIRYHNKEPLEIRNQSEFSLEIPAYVMDVLAAFYYVRTQKLEPGMPLYMSNHDNNKVYDLQVIVQRRERIKVDAGEFNTIMIQPRLKGEAIFKQKGELWIWLTDDQYKIPVQMKSKVAVGKITTELKHIEGVPLPLPSQVRR